MTVKDEMKAAVRSGDSKRIHEAVERWMKGTISTDELISTTVSETLNSETVQNDLSVGTVTK